MTSHNFSRGWTLIELLTVVTVLGILALVVNVKYISMMRVAQEGATKGGLGALRSALNIYYNDLEGQYPSNLAALTLGGGQYISRIPKVEISEFHPNSTVESDGSSLSAVTDSGGWAYINYGPDPNFGTVWVNCTHTDTRGTNWTSY